MRTLRVVITVVGGVPLITAALSPSGCGGIDDPPRMTGADAAIDRASDDASVADTESDKTIIAPDKTIITTEPDAIVVGDGALRCRGGLPSTRIVSVPPPGTAPDPAQLCAVNPPAASSASARVTFTNYDSATEKAAGFIAIPSSLAPSVVGLPTVTVTSASEANFAMLQVTGMAQAQGGYAFDAAWPTLSHSLYGGAMIVKTTLTVACADGGTEIVEAITNVNFCFADDKYEWVSSGDSCTTCTIIAEMAPSPIVSDVKSDSLPLARVIRIAVRELARAGRNVLLMAENDAGEDAEYEWRVSKGELENVAPDIVIWTLPDGIDCPFGQVAVWNETGAVVENFVWGGV